MAKFGEALESRAQMRRAVKQPKKLSSSEIEHADNGGHVIRHRFESSGPMYHEPETHVFGKGEGKKMLAHISSVMGVKDSDGD